MIATRYLCIYYIRIWQEEWGTKNGNGTFFAAKITKFEHRYTFNHVPFVAYQLTEAHHDQSHDLSVERQSSMLYDDSALHAITRISNTEILQGIALSKVYWGLEIMSCFISYVDTAESIHDLNPK